MYRRPRYGQELTGVRRAGSFKRYVREPHRDVLALRGLAMRGFITPTTRRTRGTEWKAAVAFLASDDASFITGSTFLVDGGISAAYVTPL